MKIGNIELNGIVILAPMAGITNVAYREFMKPFGVSLSFTEMISDCGLIYDNKETYSYLQTSLQDRPVGIQVFGGEKSTIIQAIQIIENTNTQYDFIDLNLGCPVPKVTKTGAGSAWLKRPQELFEMVKSVVEISRKPVTVKIRIGWDENSLNYEEIVQGLQEAGVAAITIHPRTRTQFYSGKARYELIKDIKSKMKIPLIISGDIFTLEDAIDAKEMTNADFIMVARGALGNPKLVQQINCYYQTGKKIPNATLEEQINYLWIYANKLVKLKGEITAIKELRGIAPHFLKGYPNLKYYRLKISTQMTSLSNLKDILTEITEKLL